MGRPTKLNDEVQRVIVTALEVGNTCDVAARLAGIDRATFSRWMAGTKPDKRRFQVAVKAARVKAETDLVASIRKAADRGSYRAATWLIGHLADDDLLRLAGEGSEDGDEGEAEEAPPRDTLAAVHSLTDRRARNA